VLEALFSYWLQGSSCVMLVATDAQVDARNLRRIAARTIFGRSKLGEMGPKQVVKRPA